MSPQNPSPHVTTSARWKVPVLLLVAGIGLWLLLGGPRHVFGFDGGIVGSVVLMAAVWVSLWMIGSTPRSALDAAIPPGEWKAWIGTGFMAIALAYFFANVSVFGAGSGLRNPEARAVGTHLVLLLVAWTILSDVMASRWKGLVETDERDREITRVAAGWGRGALSVCMVSLAVMLAFSPEDRLQWASHAMLANLLVAMLMIGCFVDTAASAVQYWRDRH